MDVTVRDPQAAGLERFVGLEHIDPENLHIRRWGLIADGTSFTRRFSRGQVLFGKRRAYQRKVALAGFDGICSSDILVFEADSEGLIPELLPFIVQSDGFFEHALGTSAGSLSPRTKWRDLAGYGLCLPPKDEQQRIVDTLWAADDLCAKLESGTTACHVFHQSHLVSSLRDTRYDRVAVGSLAKFASGKAIPVTGLPGQSTQHPIPVFGGNGIAGYTASALPGVRDKVVIVGRVGQYCGEVHLAEAPCWVTDNALYTIQVSGRVDIRYLGRMLAASDLNKAKIGNYLPLINQAVLHSVLIPLPPLPVQREVSRLADNTEQALDALRQHQRATKQLQKDLSYHLLREWCWHGIASGEQTDV